MNNYMVIQQKKLMDTNVDESEIERFTQFNKIKREELNKIYGEYYAKHA